MIRRFLLGMLLFTASLASAAESPSDTQTSVSADNPRIALVGRTSVKDGVARLGYPGVTIRFVYRGPAPFIRMTAENENCFFNLSCNGWEPVVLQLKAGTNRIALPTGSAPSKGWIIELVRRTESWMGTASFDGLDLPAGCELLAPPTAHPRRLMFIGDSITCGEYNERFPPENDSTPRSTNAGRSYGMLLGRWLGAEVHLVCYGGRGITRDWSGKTNLATAPVFFELALPDDPKSTWDHAAYTPDVVVINVGTDFDSGIPAEPFFTNAYAAFVGRVRQVHPKAWILLADSGYQSDGSDGRPRTNRDLLWSVLEAVVAQQTKAGDQRIRAVHTGFYPGTPSNTHLVAFQHEQLAQDLLPSIREVTGW